MKKKTKKTSKTKRHARDRQHDGRSARSRTKPATRRLVSKSPRRPTQISGSKPATRRLVRKPAQRPKPIATPPAPPATPAGPKATPPAPPATPAGPKATPPAYVIGQVRHTDDNRAVIFAVSRTSYATWMSNVTLTSDISAMRGWKSRQTAHDFRNNHTQLEPLEVLQLEAMLSDVPATAR